MEEIMNRLKGIESSNGRIEEKLNDVCVEQEKLKKGKSIWKRN